MSETAGERKGIFAEEEANRKKQRREESVSIIVVNIQRNHLNVIVEEAKGLIIQNQIVEAAEKVKRIMTGMLKDNIFEDDAMELLPAYLVLAEANICLGSSKLKKAEEFLIAAYWNLLKNSSNEQQQDGESDSLVSKEEISQYRARLHKTFGRLFLSQMDPATHPKALEELSNGIFLECQEFGPEDYHLCSSYFYMGELFRNQNQLTKARAYYFKIAQIWRKFITEFDLKIDQNMNPVYSEYVDSYFYQEAYQHLGLIKQFFENELGSDHVMTAEVYLANALVALKNGDPNFFEDLQRSHVVYQQQLGEFDPTTKMVEDLIHGLDQFNMQQ